MAILARLFPDFLRYGEEAVVHVQSALAPALLPEAALSVDTSVAALLGPASADQRPRIQQNEPAPDVDAVQEFPADIIQLSARQPPISLSTFTRGTTFDKFEVRQGWLLNCPLAAVLVAMAHVDEHRAAANRRLPRMARREFQPLRLVTTQRPTLLAEEQQFLEAEQQAGRRTTIKRRFHSDSLFHCHFYNRTEPIITSDVLFWQKDWERLLYAWSSTGVLWPSAIEKCYIYELRRPRAYAAIQTATSTKLAALGSLAAQPLFDEQALSDERAQHRLAYPAYQNIQRLPGLLVMIDLVGPSNDFAVSSLTDADLRLLLGRHRQRATILGVKDEDELEIEDYTFTLTPNHYVAVIGFDPSSMQTTIVDALGEGPDGLANRRQTIDLQTLRVEVGEIVQEL